LVPATQKAPFRLSTVGTRSPGSRYNYRFGWVCDRGGAPVLEFGQEGFDGLLELGFVDHE